MLRFGFDTEINKEAFDLIETKLEQMPPGGPYGMLVYTSRKGKVGDIYFIEHKNNNMYSMSTESGWKIGKNVDSGNLTIEQIKNVLKKQFIVTIHITRKSDTGMKEIFLWKHPKYLLTQDIHMRINVPFEQKECAICLEPYGQKKLCTISPERGVTCGHYFHCDCLKHVPPDASGRVACPSCRTAGRIECCFKASPVRMIQFGKSKRQTVHSIKNDIRFLSK